MGTERHGWGLNDVDLRVWVVELRSAGAGCRMMSIGGPGAGGAPLHPVDAGASPVWRTIPPCGFPSTRA